MGTFRTENIVGKIVGQNKHTKTHVYTEGGGGSITTGRNILGDPVLRGKIEAPQVRSYNTTKHDIFLLLENGSELSVSFPFDNLVLRDGHVITLIAAFRATADKGYYIKMLNHNTGMTYDVAGIETLLALLNEEVESRGIEYKAPSSFGCLAIFGIVVGSCMILQFFLGALAIMLKGVNNYVGNNTLKEITTLVILVFFVVGIVAALAFAIRAYRKRRLNNRETIASNEVREKLISELRADLHAEINDAVNRA